jgi:hypothetical protein
VYLVGDHTLDYESLGGRKLSLDSEEGYETIPADELEGTNNSHRFDLKKGGPDCLATITDSFYESIPSIDPPSMTLLKFSMDIRELSSTIIGWHWEIFLLEDR